MTQIDYYFSVLSPFTYLAGDALERIAAKHDASIAYKPIDVNRLFGETGGVPVGKRHPSRLAYRTQDLKRIARRSGLAFNLNPAHWPTDFTLATAALLAAAEEGDGDVGAAARALMAACWAEERDIARPEVVAEALKAGGFDFAALEDGLDAARARIGPLTDEARERGVFGAPTYVVGDEVFWGQDRLSYLDEYLAG